MLYFGREDTQMLKHVDEVIGDRILDGTYDASSQATADKLGKIATPSLVIDGSEMTAAECTALLRQVVLAELANWIPGASQRLLHRAGAALGIELANLVTGNPDCGLEPRWHALVSDWTAGIYVRRCVTCGRRYKG